MHHVAKRRTGGGPPQPSEESGSDPDGSLLLRARREPELFGRFFDRNHARVVRYFLRLTGSPHLAAELAAETFAQALAGLRGFDPDRGSGVELAASGSPGTSSTTTCGGARSTAATGPGWAWPRQRRASTTSSAWWSWRTRPSGWPSSGWPLDQLSDVVRAAVELRVGHELPYAEVAAQLGCTEGCARVRVARGMRQLTAAMVDP